MARLSRSNCRHCPPRFSATLLVVLLLALVGCASDPAARPSREQEFATSDTAGGRPLLALREYLAAPVGEQASIRARLENDSAGDSDARLQYALVLSVDRDDVDKLVYARDVFRERLAAPDPLPMALDALVRLQLGQVMDRLERMQAQTDLQQAYATAATQLKTCKSTRSDDSEAVRALRAELEQLQQKLKALARIEQTVNEPRRKEDD